MNRKSLEQKMENPLLVLETRNYCAIASEDPCKHCSVESYVGAKPQKNSGIDWLDVIKQFSEFGTKGHVVLKNGAGALGNIEISILEKTLNEGLSASITTEGVCVPDKFKSELYKLADEHEGKLGVTVSLDGETPEIYGQLRKPKHFDRTISFIRDAQSHGLDVATNYVVHAGNVDSLQDYVSFAVKKLGVKKVNLLELNSTGNAKRNGLKEADSQQYFNVLMRTFTEGDEQIRQALEGTFAAEVYKAENGLSEGCTGCPAGSKGMYFIQHKGEIFPCSSLELPQYHVGNVKKMTLAEADKSMEFGYARKVAQSLKTENPLVSMCPGRLESFGEQGRMEQATEMTKIITNYLKEKDIKLTKGNSCNCYSPAF